MKSASSVTPADILLGAVLILLSVALIFFPSEKDGTAVTVTTPEGSLSYPLSEDRTVEIMSEGHTLTLEILSGKARIADADCPDRLCVRMGEVSNSTKVIVCAPAKVAVRITSPEGGDSDADIIVGG